MHAFDRWLGRRTLGFTAAAAGAAAMVVAMTDEAGSSMAMRAARLAALAPGLAALGASLALGQAASRGELRALAALGTGPWRVGLGASVAGWLIGIASAAVLCSTWADTRALFPAVASSALWSPDGVGFFEPYAGMRVLPAGTFRAMQTIRPRPTGIGPSRFAALLAVAPLSAVLPVWVTAPLSSWGRVMAVATTTALVMTLLHLVASGQVPAVALSLAACPAGVHILAAAMRVHGRRCSSSPPAVSGTAAPESSGDVVP